MFTQPVRDSLLVIQALETTEELATDEASAEVIDLYSIKPYYRETVLP